MAKLDLAAVHVQANTSALAHRADFRNHCEHLTAHARQCAPNGAVGTLCVLGAGNCYDLDLVDLASHYAEIHLVDVDKVALSRAVSSLDPTVQSKFTLHAPVDLSGLFDRIERWARFEITPEELMSHAANTALAIKHRLGRTFDVVVSACMLSQMQLSVLHALGDSHQLFQAVRLTLNLTHFRTLAELTRPNGFSLFATDVTAESLFPLTTNTRLPMDILTEATRANQVFDFADPDRVHASLLDDPTLKRVFPRWNVDDAWLWTNGPKTTFLVYCARLLRV